MAKRNRKSRRPETLIRTVAITGASVSVSLGHTSERDVDPEFESSARIELVGTMDESIREIRDVQITLYSTDRTTVGKKPVPWIGLVNGFRPTVRPTVFVPEPAFSRVWNLVMGGMAKFAYMTLTKPHYHDAYVLYLSVSTHPEE